MVRLAPAETAIVACFADAGVLDQWPVPGGAFGARIAPDELWLIGPRSGRGGLLQGAQAQRERGDPGGLVVDQTDGWTVWSVCGPSARAVLGRLCMAQLPTGGPAFLQGAVAGVAGKIILDGDSLYVLVPSPVGHHFRDRVLDACADLHPQVGEALPFAAPEPVDARLRAVVGAVNRAPDRK